jgi:ATP-binding protein involved in chromosome partitioning
MTDILMVNAALDGISGAERRISGVKVEGGQVRLILDVSGLSPDARDSLDKQVHQALEALPGITEIRVAMTQERSGRTLIAVASGKGGVGKSTLSANLAIALARGGRKTGLIDADIYGPSQPKIMAVEGQKPTAEGQQLIPVQTPYGVPLLSMGQLVAPGQAIAWRGPMAGNALSQLIDADWSGYDTLIVDMPPGTGDVQLSMVQKHKPAGAVIVSTPQDLALIDAERAISLFNTAGVPIIGLIENMAGYACPHCGEVSDPFGKGGAEAAAARLGIPFLGRVPLDIAIRTQSDAGEPPAASDAALAQPFVDIAAWISTWASNRRG